MVVEPQASRRGGGKEGRRVTLSRDERRETTEGREGVEVEGEGKELKGFLYTKEDEKRVSRPAAERGGEIDERRRVGRMAVRRRKEATSR